MIPSPVALLDVDYRADHAVAAWLIARALGDSAPAAQGTVRVAKAAAYRAGSFFERELPALRVALLALPERASSVVIDGYVFLDAAGHPGLGAHLYEALGRATPVIGVAKTPFMGSPHAIHVLRGTSKRPLYVTGAGVDPREAADAVRAMHGAHRMPTLLGLADRLARSAAPW